VLSCLVYCFQLPGFYFDPNKKRYFRIVPGHDAVISGAVTSSDITSNSKYKRSCPALPASDSVQGERIRASRSCFVSTVQNMQMGQATACNVRSQILSGIVRNLAWRNVSLVSPVPEHLEDHVDIDNSYVSRIFCTLDDSQLICQWGLEYRSHCSRDAPVDILQRIEVTDAEEACSKGTRLQCVPVGYHRSTLRHHSIMSACVAPTNIFSECRVPPVLYAADVLDVDRKFQVNTVAVLDTLDRVGGDCDSFDLFGVRFRNERSYSFQIQRPNHFRVFYVGKKCVWSCAWSPGLNSEFAVGTEKLAYVFNADTGIRFSLDTTSSDVLSLAYASPVSVEIVFMRLDCIRYLTC